MLKYLILIMPVCVVAQDFENDVAKWHKKILESSSYSTKVRIEMYDDVRLSEPILLRNASVDRFGKSMLVKIDDITILYTDSLIISVNHSARLINVSGITLSDSSFIPDIAGLDSIMDGISSISYLGIENKRKHYHIKLSKGVIQAADLFFSTRTNMLESLKYFYDSELAGDAYIVEIEYYDNSFESIYPEQFFSPEQFIRIEGAKIVSTQKYQEYEVYYKY